MMPSEASIKFISSLAQSVAAKYYAGEGKLSKNVPTAKKIIAKSLAKLTDSELVEHLEAHCDYFEKLLDLMITDTTTVDENVAKAHNYLVLFRTNLKLNDIIAIQKTLPKINVENMIWGILRTPNCSPQDIAAALVRVDHWQAAHLPSLVHTINTRLAMLPQESRNSPKSCKSIDFLLAFTTVHACCFSRILAAEPCWTLVATCYCNVSCFSYAGNVSYWILLFESKGINISAENIHYLCQQILSLLLSARKHCGPLLTKTNDAAHPVCCLLTQRWLRSVVDSTEKRKIMREIDSFMRQWESRMKLPALWDMLVEVFALCPDINNDLIAHGKGLCSNQYSTFSEWFIGQDILVNRSMRWIEAFDGDIAENADNDSSDDDEESGEVEICLDGKASLHPWEDKNIVELENEKSTQSTLYDAGADEDDDKTVNVTFFLDKNGSTLMNTTDSADKSKILLDLEDMGAKSKKRKSSLVGIQCAEENEDNNEEDETTCNKRNTRHRLAKSKELEDSLMKPMRRSTRNIRSLRH